MEIAGEFLDLAKTDSFSFEMNYQGGPSRIELREIVLDQGGNYQLAEDRMLDDHLVVPYLSGKLLLSRPHLDTNDNSSGGHQVTFVGSHKVDERRVIDFLATLLYEERKFVESIC